MVDTGIEYEALGNTTKLPAADAGEHAITSTYYVDNQVATQEQNKTLDSYVYDPGGRTMETSSENTETKVLTKTVSHYAGAGEAVTWTSEGTEKWTRNIPGIDGTLCAVQTSTSEPTLQLHDLQGNIVATASLSEGATEPLSKYNSTEFGVPSEGKTPPKYAWLGATGLSTETAFGTGIATKGGASYVPQVARDLQTAPVIPPGAMPNGIAGGTQYTATIGAGELAAAEAIAKQIFEEAEAARQATKQREAEEAAARGRGISEPSEQEWQAAYKVWVGGSGARVAGATASMAAFHLWVTEIIEEGNAVIGKYAQSVWKAGSEVGGSLLLYGLSAVKNNWEVQVEMVAWGQVWWAEPLRFTAAHWEVALGCAKSGLEDARSVALTPVLGGTEDPFEDMRITAAAVLGCVSSQA